MFRRAWRQHGQTRRFLTIVLCALAAAGLCLSQPALAEIVKIAVTGDPVPEGNGEFNSFPRVYLNNTGQAAFYANLQNTPGGSLDSNGIYLFNGTNIAKLARADEMAPEGNGDFRYFLEPVLNDAGQVAFFAVLRNTAGGAADEEGIYFHDGTSLMNVARAGDTVPDGDGVFERLSVERVLNDAGHVAFHVYSPIAQDGIYVYNGQALAKLARRNDPLPDGDGTFGSFTSYPSVNSSGQVAFQATGGSGRAVYLHTGESFVELSREGDAPPEGNGVFTAYSTRAQINDLGQVATLAYLRNTIEPPNDGTGIYLHDGANLVTIARENTPAPDGNGVFGDLDDPVLNSEGMVAFRTNLRNTIGGGTGNGAGPDDTGLYLHDGAALVNLARENNPAPEGNGDFSRFSEPAMNRTSLVAFAAVLKNIGPDSTTGSGVYLTDGIETLNAARTGDVLAGKTVSSIWIAASGSHGLGSGGEDGRGSGLNDFGQLGFRTFFTDDSQGIFLYTPDLHWRGTAADSQWDSRTNWTLSIAPAHVHEVAFDPDVGFALQGPAAAATVASLDVNAQSSGVAELQLQAAGPLTVVGETYIGPLGAIDVGQSTLTTDTLTVDGGTVAVTLAGTTPGVDFGQIHVTSGVTIGSTLDVTLATPFVPTAGDSFEIMTFGSRTGEFDTVTGAGLIDNGTFLLPVYSDTSLTLLAVIPGDGNLDGTVGVADYTVWANGFGISDPDFTTGDYNGNGFLGPADFTLWANNFGQSVMAPVGTAATVPEPSAWALLVLGLLSALVFRRRGACFS